MTTRKLFALALAATLLSAPFAVSADAATRARSAATTRQHAAKPVKPVKQTRRSPAPRATPGSSDNSADSLNGQSLARAREQQ